MIATLSVEQRESVGSNACKQLRKTGKIPGVVYGEKRDPLPISISSDDFSQVLRHKGVIELNVGEHKENVMVKDIQYNAFGDYILHVDFQRISLDRKIRVSVPLKFLGTPEGIKGGGRLDVQMHELTVSCFHDQIPENIEVPIEHVEAGQQLKIQEIEFPSQITIEEPLHKTVLIVHIPRGLKGKQAEESEEEEATAES